MGRLWLVIGLVVGFAASGSAQSESADALGPTEEPPEPEPEAASPPETPSPAPDEAEQTANEEAADAEPADEERTVHLRIEAERSRYGLSYESGTSYRGNTLSAAVVILYESVCLAPCEADLPAGEYRFAVEDDGDHYPTGRRVQLEDDTSLYLAIDRPRVQRTFGVLLTLGGLAVAGAFFGRILARSDDDENPDLARDAGLGAGGGALALIGIITLAFAETEARVTLGPGG